MTTTYNLIQKITVGSGGASSVTFSSIPNTFTDLKLVGSVRNSGGVDYVDLQLNGNSSSYSSRWILGNGSSASSASRTDTYNSSMQDISSWTGNTFSNFEMYIPNYASSNNKSYSIAF